ASAFSRASALAGTMLTGIPQTSSRPRGLIPCSGMSDRDDLLRVDGTGTVHPVGRAASQALRPRAGEWRMIPSPKELIIARSTTGGDAILKLAGEIRTPGALCDIVALAAQSVWKGELVVLAARGTRSLCFDGGAVSGASPAVAAERLGETR